MLSEAEIKAALSEELDDIAEEAKMRGISDKPGWQPDIDSHSVLRLCLRLEEETGVEISESCVPVGGFNSREQCIATMVQHAKDAIAAAQKTKTTTEALS